MAGWRIEDDAAAPGGHVWVIFAASAEQPEDVTCAAEGSLRFHQHGSVQRGDTVQAFGVIQRVGPDALTWLGHDDKTHRALAATLPLEDRLESVRLEAYDFAGPDAFKDTREAERCLRLATESIEAEHHTLLGRGTVRSFRAGTRFALSQLPREAGDEILREAFLVSVTHAGINNLPARSGAGLPAGKTSKREPVRIGACRRRDPTNQADCDATRDSDAARRRACSAASVTVARWMSTMSSTSCA